MISRLVLLTDRRQVSPRHDLLSVVADCVAAGLRTVVVREHDLPTRTRHGVIVALKALPGLTVISSRLADEAADGLHLAASQPEPPEGWWGRSCHRASEVAEAGAQGARWVTLSPWAASLSKPGYGPPLPRQAYAGHAVPVLALGGVRPSNAAAAVEAGAHGVAVMGEVMRADHPGRVVRSLLRALA